MERHLSTHWSFLESQKEGRSKAILVSAGAGGMDIKRAIVAKSGRIASDGRTDQPRHE
jgi:hypothetical protein